MSKMYDAATFSHPALCLSNVCVSQCWLNTSKISNPLQISSRKFYKQHFHHRTSAYQPVQPWDSCVHKFQLLLGTSILQFVEQAPKIAIEIENLALNWIYCFSLLDFIRFDWNLHLIALFNPIPIRCCCCFRKEFNNKSILYTAHNIQHSTYHLGLDFLGEKRKSTILSDGASWI